MMSNIWPMTVRLKFHRNIYLRTKHKFPMLSPMNTTRHTKHKPNSCAYMAIFISGSGRDCPMSQPKLPHCVWYTISYHTVAFPSACELYVGAFGLFLVIIERVSDLTTKTVHKERTQRRKHNFGTL